jgi:hypothetical protein
MSPSDQPTGSEVIVKTELLEVSLSTVTENAPELAPEGTTTVMVVSDQFTTAAAVPFNATVLLP